MMSIIKPSLRAADFSYNTKRAWKSSLLSSQEAGQIKNQQSFSDPLEKWSHRTNCYAGIWRERSTHSVKAGNTCLPGIEAPGAIN